MKSWFDELCERPRNIGTWRPFFITWPHISPMEVSMNEGTALERLLELWQERIQMLDDLMTGLKKQVACEEAIGPDARFLLMLLEMVRDCRKELILAMKADGLREDKERERIQGGKSLSVTISLMRSGRAMWRGEGYEAWQAFTGEVYFSPFPDDVGEAFIEAPDINAAAEKIVARYGLLDPKIRVFHDWAAYIKSEGRLDAEQTKTP